MAPAKVAGRVRVNEEQFAGTVIELLYVVPEVDLAVDFSAPYIIGVPNMLDKDIS